MAGLLAAYCLCFSPPLKAAVTVETFTDYNAFLKLLGSQAQVVNFDDVPTLPLDPSSPSYRYGYFDSGRYANQGILIRAETGAQAVWSLPSVGAVSPPNVYSAALGAAPFPPTFREVSELSFTRAGAPALTSGFGTFFINNYEAFGPGTGSVSFMEAYGADGSLLVRGDPATTAPNGSTFLGFATVDSSSGALVPAIDQIQVIAGLHDLVDVYLDNFTFATPVPEGNAWALLVATALAVVGMYRRRVAAA